MIEILVGRAKTYKYLEMCVGGFYNPIQILSYGKPWNFITGSRSIGKSTNLAIFFILDYLINGHKWIYTRRTKDEVLLTAPTFFGNAVNIINSKTPFKIHSVEYEAQKFWLIMEDEYKSAVADERKPERIECGMVIPLSQEQKYKSANLSAFFNIIYDEFIAKNTAQYLGNANTPEREYNSILSLYQTVDRGIDKPYRNEVMIFFLGNTATIYNPIYLSLGMPNYIKPDSKIVSPKNKLWILQQIETVDALGDIEKSYAYQLSDDVERAYAFKNKGVEESDTAFIKIPEIAVYDETFKLDGKEYGIRHDADYNYYIGKCDKSVTMKYYSLDVNSHTGIDLKLVHRMMAHPLTLFLHDAYMDGKLYFNNPMTRQAWLKYLQFLPK